MATPLSPLTPRGIGLGDEVYSTLSQAILDGTFAPGERLRDVDLAESLGVSRTPVREALQRLERSGLVEVSPNRYTRVSIPDDNLVGDTEEFLAYTLATCLRLVVERGDDETLQEAGDLLGGVIAASRADDRAAVMQASAIFFRHITVSTRNSVFLRVLRDSEVAIRRNLIDWQPSIACPIERSSRYETLRDAMLGRDAERAEALTRELHGFS